MDGKDCLGQRMVSGSSSSTVEMPRAVGGTISGGGLHASRQRAPYHSAISAIRAPGHVSSACASQRTQPLRDTLHQFCHGSWSCIVDCLGSSSFCIRRVASVPCGSPSHRCVHWSFGDQLLLLFECFMYLIVLHQRCLDSDAKFPFSVSIGP